LLRKLLTGALAKHGWMETAETSHRTATDQH
jgi:hypothetical protein